jgi:hypothetical protein
LLAYGFVFAFVADAVRDAFDSRHVSYVILQSSVSAAVLALVLILAIHGPARLGLWIWKRDSAFADRIADLLFGFSFGLLLPLVIIESRLFSRFPGIPVLATLLISAVAAMLASLFIFRRHSGQGSPLMLSGFAASMICLLISSEMLGIRVAKSARDQAEGHASCLASGVNLVTSSFDMTPLTLVSTAISEYNAELIVDTSPDPTHYNWSWRALAFEKIPRTKWLHPGCPN